MPNGNNINTKWMILRSLRGLSAVECSDRIWETSYQTDGFKGVGRGGGRSEFEKFDAAALLFYPVG